MMRHTKQFEEYAAMSLRRCAMRIAWGRSKTIVLPGTAGVIEKLSTV